MKYRLKDICSITKGATGIMKADGGKYPLVALSDERRSHSEFQFDTKAVIVPLISSTGHGHASMKRVHYQEGKFALGNILCAVIPNDEKQLNAKYLHLYLQQFKETLLVPLMKGAANVSLPINKLAVVEIEVPSLERQLEIIALEEEAAEYKNELEERLIAQDGDVAKLRQALLKEAIQGKLTNQETNDGNAKKLLEKIKAEKTKIGIKEKSFTVIKNEEIPFLIPENWEWCRIEELFFTVSPRGKQVQAKEYLVIGKYPIVDQGFKIIIGYNNDSKLLIQVTNPVIVFGDHTKEIKYIDFDFIPGADGTKILSPFLSINAKWFYYFLKSLNLEYRGYSRHFKFLKRSIVPLPPVLEQNRIVNRIEQLMQLCDGLQYSIQQSNIENKKLLQGALRDALKKESVEV